MATLVERVEKVILAKRLLSSNARIVVGVSGGLDSMVLLHLLAQLAPRHHWHLSVAHFNHQLRGRSSDADERFVRTEAARMKLPFDVASADVRKFAGERKFSIEMAARQLRHEFFVTAAKGFRSRTIALAHHADDQVESFFLRLLRGSGTEGLSGMKVMSASPVDPAFRLVRPLLDEPKENFVEYAKEVGIRYREDATNAETDFGRNQIRHRVLPVLRKQQPALNTTVVRSMTILASESEFVAQAAQEWLVSRGSSFDRLHEAVQRRCIELQLRELKIGGDFVLIELLRNAPGKQICIGPRLMVVREPDGSIKLGDVAREGFGAAEAQIRLMRNGKAEFGGLRIYWDVERSRGGLPKFSPGTEFFDAEKVGGKVTLRHWRVGDRFQPIGLTQSVKVQDLFVNAKIPREKRHKTVVAVAENGEIFWIEGLRISQNFKLGPETTRRIKWSWKIRERRLPPS